MSRELAVALAFGLGIVWGSVAASAVRLTLDVARRPVRAALVVNAGLIAVAAGLGWLIGGWLA